MRKFNVLAALFLLFWVQICFTEEIPDDYYLPISDDEEDLKHADLFLRLMGINRKYELYLSYKYDSEISLSDNNPDFFEIAPFFAANGGHCSSLECITHRETQGLANIDGKYWILSKNKWMDTFSVNEDDFFSESDSNKIEKATITNDRDKNGDIDFFNGKLYAPIKTNIYVYSWNEKTRTFTKDKEYPLDRSSFGVTVHPYTKHIFFSSTGSKSGIYGNRISDSGWECKTHKFISFQTKDGEPIQHSEITKYHWTQGIDFSPNGRFLFYVHDDAFDEWSDYSGIYVYYIDSENYENLINSPCPRNNENEEVKAKLVSFINIKYDPDVDGCREKGSDKCVRIDELEGLDVGEEIGGYDLRLLVLHNEMRLVGKEHHSVLHFATGDYDKDGVKDIYDNCPFDWNRDQADWNGDGIGDVCQDYDKDGVKDSEDNCITVPNPKQEDLDGINGGDACDDMKDGDGWPDEKDPCPYDYNEEICGGEDCRFSKTPSDCCLEARKECDIDRDGRWDEEPYNESYPDFWLSQVLSVKSEPPFQQRSPNS